MVPIWGGIAHPAQRARRKQPAPVNAFGKKRLRDGRSRGRRRDHALHHTAARRPGAARPQTALVDKDGRPTVALFDFIKKLLASEETQKAALDQLEP